MRDIRQKPEDRDLPAGYCGKIQSKNGGGNAIRAL